MLTSQTLAAWTGRMRPITSTVPVIDPMLKLQLEPPPQTFSFAAGVTRL